MTKLQTTPSPSDAGQLSPDAAATRALAYQLAKNELVPETYRNKPGNVFAALTIAQRHGIDFFFVTANLIPIHGRFGWNGAGMIGLLRASKAIKGTVHYEHEDHPDDGHRVRAWAIDAETGERVEGLWVSMRLAKAEGWTRNKKYQTMPELMLEYRAATLFTRTHYPDALMGFQEAGEIEDMAVSGHLEPRDVESDAGLDDLNAQAEGREVVVEHAEPDPPADDGAEIFDGLI